MNASESLASHIEHALADKLTQLIITHGELTLELPAAQLTAVCLILRDTEPFQFNQLMDICGVDYLHYGLSQWETESATSTGFSRGVGSYGTEQIKSWDKPRFAVVYHLLSLPYNQRIRLRVLLTLESLQVDSVVPIWPAANWFEREAFDLYGIIFNNHPELTRILTDYGFQGHPFRKDFPLIGQVEIRYDADKGACVYEPVSIQPRLSTPKVIRTDARYIRPDQKKDEL